MSELLLVAAQQLPAEHGSGIFLAIAIGLMFLAAALLLLEFFVVSGGLIAFASLAAAIAGIHYAFRFDSTTGWLFLIATPFAAWYMLRTGLQQLERSSLVPKSEIDGSSSYADHAGALGLQVGVEGTLVTAARPGGKARFGEHTVDVQVRSGSAEAGDSILIVEIRGPRILVQRHSPSASN